MTNRISELKSEVEAKLNDVTDLKSLTDLKNTYLGKNSEISNFRSSLKDLSNEEKKTLGMALNTFNVEVNKLFEEKQSLLEEKELNEKLAKDAIDISLPSTKLPYGGVHPITRVINEIEELFVSMGYDVVDGPEIETDLYNFEKLNLPKDHPARDAQDSFYIDSEYLLRTQTSPMQARTMEKSTGPIRIICPGKTYRRDDDDATHSHQFNQIEGLVVGENISVADLKGTLEIFARKMFGENTNIRFRPSYFPFTEPSLEVDVSCFKCGGEGCSLCKETGWIEILGSGMVHPNVLGMNGYDSKKYTGFAFGIGPERVAMLKYGINDIREFYTNDLRFIEQFNRYEGENNESK